MDGTRLDNLIQDHQRIRELLEEIDGYVEHDPGETARQFQRLRKLLTAHAERERGTLYAVLEEQAAELVATAVAEHDEIAELLGLLQSAFDDDEWMSTFVELREAVEEHLEEEEREIFPLWASSSAGRQEALAAALVTDSLPSLDSDLDTQLDVDDDGLMPEDVPDDPRLAQLPVSTSRRVVSVSRS